MVELLVLFLHKAPIRLLHGQCTWAMVMKFYRRIVYEFVNSSYVTVVSFRQFSWFIVLTSFVSCASSSNWTAVLVKVLKLWIQNFTEGLFMGLATHPM